VLLEEIERAVEAAGGWAAVEGIAVGLGPGSFTGLRVGVATAQALAASAGVPVVGVGTLDALARGLGRSAVPGDGDLVAVLDARRGEVFAGRYSAAGERRWGPWVGGPEALAERLAKDPGAVLAGGSGAVRFRDEIEDCGVGVPDDDSAHRVHGRDVCALYAAAGRAGDGGALAPVYLRPPDAERWLERDSSKTTG
jgi:tRNA threonylcarbamoyladenosine biosynthesis protein TsaB